jgi:hypothetical protein
MISARINFDRSLTFQTRYVGPGSRTLLIADTQLALCIIATTIDIALTG